MSVRAALLYVLAAGVLAVAAAAPASAQEQKSATASDEAELTPEEQAERESRKACKVAICAAFHNRNSDGGDIACNIVKTWRKERLEKIVSKAKVSWPWGRVQCVADIRLKRDMLIKAMTEPKHEAVLDKHRVACQIEREKDKAEIKFDFTPKVTFEGGKATKALLNWGTIEAPTLVKGAMWTATATDNTFNVLEGTVVEDINDFIARKCMEVKDDWQGK
ncbi:MAG: hypothetical protein KJZ80_13965 [Hyphomicrobiaceae bacterium]|nr:hypothetical protein [Hyphomicrobiaceae bacterium]